jgi:hypothetical protein
VKRKSKKKNGENLPKSRINFIKKEKSQSLEKEEKEKEDCLFWNKVVKDRENS